MKSPSERCPKMAEACACVTLWSRVRSEQISETQCLQPSASCMIACSYDEYHMTFCFLQSIWYYMMIMLHHTYYFNNHLALYSQIYCVGPSDPSGQKHPTSHAGHGPRTYYRMRGLRAAVPQPPPTSKAPRRILLCVIAGGLQDPDVLGLVFRIWGL